MMGPEPGPHATPAQAKERGAALALLPTAATLDFYALPASLQEQTLVQFAPQILAYLALGLWATHNRGIVSRLGLEKWKVRDGLRWGLLTGLLLGCLNTFVILSAYPHLGYDISFLKTTPHGRLPLMVMAPWFICGIALFVELNFRGFLLGRLAALESGLWRSGLPQRLSLQKKARRSAPPRRNIRRRGAAHGKSDSPTGVIGRCSGIQSSGCARAISTSQSSRTRSKSS